MKIKIVLVAGLFLAINDVSPQLKAVDSPEGIEILEAGRPVLFYQKKSRSLNVQYERAGYVHPLYNLNGDTITEDFPPDHLHHHGVFWAWHQMIYNGKPVGDSWDGRDISWEVLNTAVKEKSEKARLKSKVRWTSQVAGKTIDILEEKTEITVYRKTDDFRAIDFKIRLLPKVDNLFIGGSDDLKGYGGFSLRFRNPETLSFESQGKEITPAVQAVPAGPWMNFSGSFGLPGQSGVAVFCHPSNPGDIRQWILRDSKSMQNPVWPGREPVAIPPKGIVLQYRLIIHDGGLSQDVLEKLYQEYR